MSVCAYDSLVVGIVSDKIGCVDDVGTVVIESAILWSCHCLQVILVNFPERKANGLLGQLAECGIHLEVGYRVWTHLLDGNQNS